MAKITLKDGVLTSESYVEVTRDYICSCGENLTITLDMPEGVIFNAQISINKNCPKCNSPILIPKGSHYIENGKLLTNP